MSEAEKTVVESEEKYLQKQKGTPRPRDENGNILKKDGTIDGRSAGRKKPYRKRANAIDETLEVAVETPLPEPPTEEPPLPPVLPPDNSKRKPSPKTPKQPRKKSPRTPPPLKARKMGTGKVMPLPEPEEKKSKPSKIRSMVLKARKKTFAASESESELEAYESADSESSYEFSEIEFVKKKPKSTRSEAPTKVVEEQTSASSVPTTSLPLRSQGLDPNPELTVYAQRLFQENQELRSHLATSQHLRHVESLSRKMKLRF